MRKIKGRHLILITGALVMIVVIGAYSAWNSLSPEYTCAQCHEVSPSHAQWLNSAHAGILCVECHGTALSNGMHSIKEKMGMVFTHITGDKHNDDIHLTEKQVLEISDRCAKCHQVEYAGWLASGHAVNYREIFMDSIHNIMEKPYWDCFRCHGMFYDGTIHDLMSLDGEPSQWVIRDKKQEERPTVPCLACHQIHTENPVSKRYVSSLDTVKEEFRHPRTALYIRADKKHLRSDQLARIEMMDGNRKANSAVDNNTLLCMQCHAPNYRHHAGSEDDRTPTGVHEGISCIACHKPHSNNTQESCYQCHPSLTGKQIKAIYDNPHQYVNPLNNK